MNISAIVITKNEEKKLLDCLRSLTWVDEIIVVDSGSVDESVEIAKKFSAKVFVEKGLKGFSEPRNFGLRKSKSNWILYVDADERVTPDLQKEIKNIINRAENVYGCYAIPRKNIILGKELKYGGWWPDYVKRLYLKEKLHGWKGDLHEEPKFNGEIFHLKFPLIHLKHDGLSEMVKKTNNWSVVEAKLMYNSNHPKMNLLRFSTAVFREFWLRMVKQRAFLDGTEGVIYATYQVFSRFLSYAKLWEMQINSIKSSIKI